MYIYMCVCVCVYVCVCINIQRICGCTKRLKIHKAFIIKKKAEIYVDVSKTQKNTKI